MSKKDYFKISIPKKKEQKIEVKKNIDLPSDTPAIPVNVENKTDNVPIAANDNQRADNNPGSIDDSIVAADHDYKKMIKICIFGENVIEMSQSVSLHLDLEDNNENIMAICRKEFLYNIIKNECAIYFDKSIDKNLGKYLFYLFKKIVNKKIDNDLIKLNEKKLSANAINTSTHKKISTTFSHDNYGMNMFQNKLMETNDYLKSGKNLTKIGKDLTLNEDQEINIMDYLEQDEEVVDQPMDDKFVEYFFNYVQKEKKNTTSHTEKSHLSQLLNFDDENDNGNDINIIDESESHEINITQNELSYLQEYLKK